MKRIFAVLLNFLLLPALFLFVVTPLGLLLRLRGDPMARRWQRELSTYRIRSKRAEPVRLARPY